MLTQPVVVATLRRPALSHPESEAATLPKAMGRPPPTSNPDPAAAVRPKLGAARGLRLPAELKQEIARVAEKRGESWSAATRRMLAEAVRTRRLPGISYTEGAHGRRAVLAGTGLEVWKIVAAFRQGPQAVDALRADHPWLSDAQLQTAAEFARLFPEEVDDEITPEGRLRPRVVQEELFPSS